MASKKPSRLDLADLAIVVDGELDALSSQGCAAIIEMVRADPRYRDQIATLRAMAEDAGSEFLEHGLEIHRQLELLVSTEWNDPAELLDRDPDEVSYENLIRLATVRAERAEDPRPLLVVKQRLEATHAARESAGESFENLVEHLAALDPGTAEHMLDRLARQSRRRREETDA